MDSYDKKERLRRRVFDLIQIGHREDPVSRLFDFVIVTTIVINIVCLFLETFDELAAWRGVMFAVETVTVCIFCIEYALRIWTADLLYEDMPRWKAVLSYLLSFNGIIELLTILPFFFLKGFVVFRMLRVVRIFHLFRINAYYDSFNVIREVLSTRKNQIISSVFIILVLILASSLSMYAAEHNAQPEYFRNAFSGIWWSVSALLTVGYGDIYPVTPLGRIMAIVISFLGVGAVAIPTGIISAGFVEQYTNASGPSTNGTNDSNGQKDLLDFLPEQLRQLIAEGVLRTVLIDVDSRWAGKSIEKVEETDGVMILLQKRGKKLKKPDADDRVSAGDILIICKEAGERQEGERFGNPGK